MPADSRRVFETQRIRVIKRIRAPARYVYDWCTDYRSDDWRVARPGAHPRYRVMRLAPKRVLRIRLTATADAGPDIAVDLVRLEPPDRWHTDQVDEEELETVDYRVTAIDRTTSRLVVTVTDRWMVARHLPRAETARRVSGAWDRYAGMIEARYAAGLRAKG